MKKTLFISLLFCVLISPVWSQNGEDQSVNKTDKDGKKQGYWIEYWDGDNTIMKYYGHFKDDKPIDTFFYYYPTGEFHSWIYHDKRGYSNANVYHQNGNVMARGRYREGQKDSTWRYFDIKSNLISIENYILGKKYGLWKVYFDDGKIAKEQNWENDMKQGLTYEYYHNGNKKMMRTYENDRAEGPGAFYHENGEVRMKGEYVKDAKEGPWQKLDTTGAFIEEVIYHRGVPEGGPKVIESVDTSKYYRKDRLDESDFYPEQEYAPMDKKRKK